MGQQRHKLAPALLFTNSMCTIRDIIQNQLHRHKSHIGILGITCFNCLHANVFHEIKTASQGAVLILQQISKKPTRVALICKYHE